MDFIKGELVKIEQKEEPDGNNEEIVHLITAFEKQLNDPKINIRTYKALIYFDPNCEMENMRAYTVIHQLTPVATVVSYTPADILENEDTTEQIRAEGFTVEFTSELTYDELLLHFDHTLFLERIDLHEIEEKKKAVSAAPVSVKKAKEETNNESCKKNSRTGKHSRGSGIASDGKDRSRASAARNCRRSLFLARFHWTVPHQSRNRALPPYPPEWSSRMRNTPMQDRT